MVNVCVYVFVYYALSLVVRRAKKPPALSTATTNNAGDGMTFSVIFSLSPCPPPMRMKKTDGHVGITTARLLKVRCIFLYWCSPQKSILKHAATPDNQLPPTGGT